MCDRVLTSFNPFYQMRLTKAGPIVVLAVLIVSCETSTSTNRPKADPNATCETTVCPGTMNCQDTDAGPLCESSPGASANDAESTAIDPCADICAGGAADVHCDPLRFVELDASKRDWAMTGDPSHALTNPLFATDVRVLGGQPNIDRPTSCEIKAEMDFASSTSKTLTYLVELNREGDAFQVFRGNNNQQIWQVMHQTSDGVFKNFVEHKTITINLNEAEKWTRLTSEGFTYAELRRNESEGINYKQWRLEAIYHEDGILPATVLQAESDYQSGELGTVNQNTTQRTEYDKMGALILDIVENHEPCAFDSTARKMAQHLDDTLFPPRFVCDPKDEENPNNIVGTVALPVEKVVGEVLYTLSGEIVIKQGSTELTTVQVGDDMPFSHVLMAGDYTLHLQEGWMLSRSIADAVTLIEDAVLLDEDAMFEFTIEKEGEVVSPTIRFVADGIVVPFQEDPVHPGPTGEKGTGKRGKRGQDLLFTPILDFWPA